MIKNEVLHMEENVGILLSFWDEYPDGHEIIRVQNVYGQRDRFNLINNQGSEIDDIINEAINRGLISREGDTGLRKL
jgi:hypothetical protein